MDRGKAHRFHGTNAGEWISRIPNELELDAVGLWQIIPVGRHDFGFSGTDLEQFTREVLSGLLAKGALPITGQDGVWVIEHRYGLEADEIVENVVTRWLSEGMRDPDVEDVWFGPAAFLGK